MALVLHERNKNLFPLDRIFDDFFSDFALDFRTPIRGRRKLAKDGGIPVHVDVKETDKSFVVLADLPGVKQDEIDVSFEDQILTIKGEKKFEHSSEDKENDQWYFERSFGSFVRAIPIPAEVIFENASANYKDGVLEINLPKAPQAKAKTRKLKIN